MTFSDSFHVEFCLTSNMKWIAVGCWSDGIFGLFSLLSGSLVWSTKLSPSNMVLPTPTPLKFDSSCTRLIIRAGDVLYVFAPSCLTEDHRLEFRSTSVELASYYRDQRPHLNSYHLALLPKHILKEAFVLQRGLANQEFIEGLDMAISKTTSNVSLLIRRNGQFDIVQASFEMLFSYSFKEYMESDWSRDAQPNGVVNVKVNTLLTQRSQHVPSQHPPWIFLYPNENKDEESIVVFLMQGGIFGVFIDDTTQQQDQCLLENQECFALKQSKDRNRVFCLHTIGVMIVSLSERTIICQVAYKANLSKWMAPYMTSRYSK